MDTSIGVSVASLARAHAIQRLNSSLPSVQHIVEFVGVLVDLSTKRAAASEGSDGLGGEGQSSLHGPSSASPSSADPAILAADYDAYCTARDALGDPMFSRFLDAQAFCKVRHMRGPLETETVTVDGKAPPLPHFRRT
jgi:hypothetical protein